MYASELQDAINTNSTNEDIEAWGWGWSHADADNRSGPPDSWRNRAHWMSVSEVDYACRTEAKLVRLMRLRVLAVLKGHTDACKWLHWFFGGRPDEFGLRFCDCTVSLGCDPWVVREQMHRVMREQHIQLARPIIGAQAPVIDDRATIQAAYQAAWEQPGGDLQSVAARLMRDKQWPPQIVAAAFAHLLREEILIEGELGGVYAG